VEWGVREKAEARGGLVEGTTGGGGAAPSGLASVTERGGGWCFCGLHPVVCETLRGGPRV
jgi:hypothetical protein